MTHSSKHLYQLHPQNCMQRTLQHQLLHYSQRSIDEFPQLKNVVRLRNNKRFCIRSRPSGIYHKSWSKEVLPEQIHVGCEKF